MISSPMYYNMPIQLVDLTEQMNNYLSIKLNILTQLMLSQLCRLHHLLKFAAKQYHHKCMRLQHFHYNKLVQARDSMEQKKMFQAKKLKHEHLYFRQWILTKFPTVSHSIYMIYYQQYCNTPNSKTDYLVQSHMLLSK